MDVSFFNQASDVRLEVEINPKFSDRFEEKYRELTGKKPVLGGEYQHQSNKRGREFRVYFNSNKNVLDELELAGVYVESAGRSYQSNRAYRINDRDFFWSLIRFGYRLGDN